jgi:glucuronoarabinoxylan endo-1,4-beta-xylanase
VADDSYVLDYLSDPACVSIDMTKVTELPETLPWTPQNRVVYLPEGSNPGQNMVVGSDCQSLVLTEDGGDFRPVNSFTAQQASLTLSVDGCRMVMVPFNAEIPEGVKAYAVDASLNLTPITTITAHTPCLLQAQGTVTLTGTGSVSYSTSALNATFRGSYTAAPLFAGDYVLAKKDDQWGFSRLTAASTLQPFDAYAQLSSTTAFRPIQGDVLGIRSVTLMNDDDMQNDAVYDLQGRRVQHPSKGLYIHRGRKVVMK